MGAVGHGREFLISLKGISKNGLWAMSGPYEIKVRGLPDMKNIE